jgi:osmotically-inducible protein OsmY
MKRIGFALSVATAGLILGATAPRARADESSSVAAANTKEEQAIRTQFQKAPDLGNNHITVTVDDGIAVLEGTVDSEQEKKEAQRIAHVDGILGVNNRLHVRGAAK